MNCHILERTEVRSAAPGAGVVSVAWETVSSNGGTRVRWRRDGRELLYVEEVSNVLMAVEVSTEGEFSLGRVTRLFQHEGLAGVGNYAPYDVSADGQRFLLSDLVEEETGTVERSIHVVENWFTEFVSRQ